MEPKKGFDINEFTDDLEKKEVNIQGYRLNVLQLCVLIGAVVELVACFLPMYTVGAFGISVSVNYIQGDGIFAIALALATFACIYFHKALIALITSIANFALVIYASFLGIGSEYAGLISRGIGAYLLALSAFVILVVTVLIFMREKNEGR